VAGAPPRELTGEVHAASTTWPPGPGMATLSPGAPSLRKAPASRQPLRGARQGEGSVPAFVLPWQVRVESARRNHGADPRQERDGAGQAWHPG
jgi:hypothetical protein